MFSRILTMHLKPNHVTEYIKTADETILPILRKQEGFRDAIFFADKHGTQAVAISFWDRKEQAEGYATKGYPQVLQTITPLIEGSPQVQELNVTSSTLHKMHTAV